MFLSITIAMLLGIFTGIFTGLIPGIHVNLVSVILVSSSALFLTFTTPIVLAVYIISLAITHTFLDALPSIYLGAPDAGQELNVLPGHRLLLKGEGHNAVTYTVIGAFGSLLLCALLFPILIYAMKYLDPIIKGMIGYFLIVIMAYMVLKEKGKEKKIKSLTLFLLSGCLGLLVFAIPKLNQPLFPLLSGLFGLSILLISLKDNTSIPKQKTDQPLKLSKKKSC